MENEPLKTSWEAPLALESVERENTCGNVVHIEPSGTGQSEANIHPSNLSKRQLKRQQKRHAYEAYREERKVRRREKRKAGQERRRARIEAGEPPDTSTLRKRRPRKQVHVPLTFIIDASFDSLMTEAEAVSLAAQISRCYSCLKSSSRRPKMAIANFRGRLRERYDGPMRGQYKSWTGVRFCEEGVKEVGNMAAEWMDAIPQTAIYENWPNSSEDVRDEPETAIKQTKLVYLTADSPNVLTSLSPHTSYVVGGLIDRNRHKGRCYRTALEAGIETARLPIDEYIQLSSRKVLTINHVVEIMIQWMETGDWEKSFLDIIPARKGAAAKEHDGFSDEGGEEAAPLADEAA
jgi:tRNA (guanine9-N1)-methyltransferase